MGIPFGGGQFNLRTCHGNLGRDGLSTGFRCDGRLRFCLAAGTYRIDGDRITIGLQTDGFTERILRPRGAGHRTGETCIIMGWGDLRIELEALSGGCIHILAGDRNLYVVLSAGGVLMAVSHDGERGVNHLDAWP